MDANMHTPNQTPFMYRKTVAVSAFILTTTVVVCTFILAATLAATTSLWATTLHVATQREDPAAISHVTLQLSHPPMQCRKTATRTT
jgi:hypothetical protein